MRWFSVAVLAFFGLVAFGCHEINQSDQHQIVADQQWVQFSAQHHCKVIRESDFWKANVIWQCDDGFQVIRRDNQ